jgi:hypothetical protein
MPRKMIKIITKSGGKPNKNLGTKTATKFVEELSQ